MKLPSFLIAFAAALAVCTSTFAADEPAKGATAAEKTFVKKAAMGGMTEVALGKVATDKGGSQDVKDFGNHMVTDHTKINDNLKEVAGKMGAEIPSELDTMHKALVDKMEKMSGAAFDKTYVKAMVKDHQQDIAEFEKAEGMAKNDDLKKFIKDSLPTMKEHLEKIKKFDQAKG